MGGSTLQKEEGLHILQSLPKVADPISGAQRQPPPNREQRCSHSMPRCEGGKACVAGLTTLQDFSTTDSSGRSRFEQTKQRQNDRH